MSRPNDITEDVLERLEYAERDDAGHAGQPLAPDHSSLGSDRRRCRRGGTCDRRLWRRDQDERGEYRHDQR